jgi:RNA polymerase II-associated protein 1
MQPLLTEFLLQGMLMNLISHNKQSTSNMDEQMDGLLHEESWLKSRMKVLIEACEGNSSLLTQVKKLKDAAEKNSL